MDPMERLAVYCECISCAQPVSMTLVSEDAARRCITYIDQHLAEPLTAASLASAIGYSDYYLSRKFQTETKKALPDYLRERRVERAKLLLSDTDLSAAEISEDVDFKTPSHFGAVFRKQTGRSPSCLRQSHVPFILYAFSL